MITWPNTNVLKEVGLLGTLSLAFTNLRILRGRICLVYIIFTQP